MVQVDMVHPNFVGHKLKITPNDEIIALGEALLQRIQWNKSDIQLNPPALSIVFLPPSAPT